VTSSKRSPATQRCPGLTARRRPTIWPTNSCPLPPPVPNSAPALPSDRACYRLFRRLIPHWNCGTWKCEVRQRRDMPRRRGRTPCRRRAHSSA
jgi:hypothetical protein